jgi:hypothetical protein
MNWKKLHFYVHTIFRYFLATNILSYAIAKILGTQFTSGPHIYDQSIDSLNGFELTWFFYGYSYWYAIAIAIAQILSAILLFFRRTTRLGIVLFLSFMINILLVDFAYDIDGAKEMAVLLTFMALFVFFSEFSLFYKYFFIEPPLYPNNKRPNWVNKFNILKWFIISISIIGMIWGLTYLKNEYLSKDQFYGTWKNTDSTSVIHRLNFESIQFYNIHSYYDNKEVVWGNYSFKEDSIFLKCFTKEYQTFLENDKTGEVLHPDTTKIITFLKGKFKLTDKRLVIQSDSSKIIFDRIR